MLEIKKILIAEDEEDLMFIFSSRLEIEGFEVLKAIDGEEALNQIKTFMPDFILLDLMLPKMSGYDVCGIVKSNPQLNDIPIFIISALSERHNRDEAMRQGADDFFIKPFDLDQLIRKIYARLEK